jgi:HAD superfamily hydrolase (TIGR01459 family)
MSAPRIIAGLSEIAGSFDALLCDVWGVIHNGREHFPAACDALARFRRDIGPVILLSNAPRPSEAVKPQLRGLGVPDAAWSAYVSSGDATIAELVPRVPGPAWAIGPERDLSLYEGLDLRLTDGPEDAAFISCTGFTHEETEVPGDYRERLILARARGLVMVCANPDLVVHVGDRLTYCAGALAQLYGELGGEVVMAGKPHAPIYRVGLETVERELGRPADRSRLLCIGDGIGTDVKGANAAGLACLFIAAGIHGAEAVTAAGGLDGEKVDALLAGQGARADYAMPRLAW